MSHLVEKNIAPGLILYFSRVLCKLAVERNVTSVIWSNNRATISLIRVLHFLVLPRSSLIAFVEPFSMSRTRYLTLDSGQGDAEGFNQTFAGWIIQRWYGNFSMYRERIKLSYCPIEMHAVGAFNFPWYFMVSLPYLSRIFNCHYLINFSLIWNLTATIHHQT